MGWKGVIRSIQAAQRASEREAKRHQRELERQEKELHKLQELERAAYEVDLYDNRIEVLSSVHKDCGNSWNWETIKNQKPPQKPAKKDSYEKSAKNELDNFKPNIFDKIFVRIKKKIQDLEQKLEHSRKLDEKEFQNEIKKFESEYEDWEEARILAENILKGDKEAYAKAIKEINSFSEISELGSSIKFNIDGVSNIEIGVNKIALR